MSQPIGPVGSRYIVYSMSVPPSGRPVRRQSSTSERVHRGETEVAVNDHRTPDSSTMNSSSTVDIGIFTGRRAPIPVAGPSTSIRFTLGNHSVQRSWSASTAKTTSGGAGDVAVPRAWTGAEEIQSSVRGVTAAMGRR